MTKKKTESNFMLWLQKQVMLTGRMNGLEERQEDLNDAIRRLTNSVSQLQEERSQRLAQRSMEAGADVVKLDDPAAITD